ncbi:hypothetical protein ACJX0J_009323, partial [Zea mays]
NQSQIRNARSNAVTGTIGALVLNILEMSNLQINRLLALFHTANYKIVYHVWSKHASGGNRCRKVEVHKQGTNDKDLSCLISPHEDTTDQISTITADRLNVILPILSKVHLNHVTHVLILHTFVCLISKKEIIIDHFVMLKIIVVLNNILILQVIHQCEQDRPVHDMLVQSELFRVLVFIFLSNLTESMHILQHSLITLNFTGLVHINLASDQKDLNPTTLTVWGQYTCLGG